MNLKLHEIVLVILAVAVPVTILTLAFVPGGMNWVFDLVLDPVIGPIVFYTGAAMLAVLLAWRIFRRINPPAKKKAPPSTPHVSPTRMPKVEGSEAVERLKNRKP
jgi:hypothetical protein